MRSKKEKVKCKEYKLRLRAGPELSLKFLLFTPRMKLDLAQGRGARGEEGSGDCHVDPRGT